jgi:glycosyltransferase involved in cell wall biosynthesis
MRICLLGTPPDEQLDEGMKNMAFHLFQGLSRDHEVIILDPRSIRTSQFWHEIKAFRPEVIHYTSGPSPISLLTLKFVKLQTSTKTFASAIHPWFPAGTKFLIGVLAPDVVLAPSKRTQVLFSKYGCNVLDLAIGVDINKFIPVAPFQKTALRQQYNLTPKKYIVLHVGHIRKKRGIEALVNLQNDDQQVVVLGSLSSKNETNTQTILEQAGCIVIRQHIQRIEELYALSDCYVFPTQDPLSAIEIPLSILEAMACNLPVIAYPFGGLPDLFQTGEGLIFEARFEQWPLHIQAIRNGNMTVDTRKKVLPLDWSAITKQLEKFYYSSLDA